MRDIILTLSDSINNGGASVALLSVLVDAIYMSVDPIVLCVARVQG